MNAKHIKKKAHMFYYVLRTYSHTDKQQLWKVMSRRFTSSHSAENWKDFCETQEKNKKHKFFVISIEEIDEG